MELSHTFTVPASLDQTWDTFMDLQEVGSCFPGATVTEVTEDGFSGTVKVKLGPIALVYSGTGSFVERDDAAHRAVIEAKGKDKRGNGTAGATVTVELFDAGDGNTRAEVQTDLNITGKPAQFGRGVMQDVSDKLLNQFVACIEGKVGTPPAAEEPVAQAHAESNGSAATAAPAADAPVPVPAPAAAARTPTPTREPEALDLGTAVLPVVLKSYAAQIAAGLVALLAAIGLVRWCRRKG